MMYRTSRWVHLHNDFVDKVLEKLFSLCNQKKTDYFIYENSRYSIANKSLKQVQCEFHKQAKDYQIVTQLDTALKLISIRKYDGLLVSKLANEHHLITSDNPVILSNIVPGRIAPFDPENMLSLPIDHTHLLTILPHSQTDSSHRIMRLHINGGMSAGKMIVNNGSQFTSCQKHLLGSKSGLTEYYKNKEKYESPITEEQANNLDSIYKKARDLGIIK